MWAGLEQQREQMRQAGLELAPGGRSVAGITTAPGSSRSPPAACSPPGTISCFSCVRTVSLLLSHRRAPPAPEVGDTIVSLGPVPVAQPAEGLERL